MTSTKWKNNSWLLPMLSMLPSKLYQINKATSMQQGRFTPRPLSPSKWPLLRKIMLKLRPRRQLLIGLMLKKHQAEHTKSSKLQAMSSNWLLPTSTTPFAMSLTLRATSMKLKRLLISLPRNWELPMMPSSTLKLRLARLLKTLKLP